MSDLVEMEKLALEKINETRVMNGLKPHTMEERAKMLSGEIKVDGFGKRVK